MKVRLAQLLFLGVFAALLYGWGKLVTSFLESHWLKLALFLVGAVIVTWLTMTPFVRYLNKQVKRDVL